MDEKYCPHCGSEKRTEAPAEEAAAEEAGEVEDRTETPAEETEVTEEVTNGHVIDSGEAQLAKLGLQRRQRAMQLQEKRYDPFLDTDDE